MPSADFIGWDALARELGLEGAAVAKLEVAHRSTAQIMAVADTLSRDETGNGRGGPKPRLHRADSPARAHEILVAEVDRLARDHAQGHVAVVTPTRRLATDLAVTLAAELPGISVRHGHNEAFVFEPGVTVTNMAQIKGLEFDAVVVVDPTESAYPSEGDDGRRRLYTVCTRAKSELVFVVDRDPTQLLGPAIERGLVELADEPIVPPFENDDDPF